MVFCLLVSLSCIAASEISQNKNSVSQKDKLEIIEVVIKIKESILSNNSKIFLKHVSLTEGLSCTDTKYSNKEVDTFLKNKNSYLYISLFDSKRFYNQCSNNYQGNFPAISEREFLQNANEDITITRINSNWVEINITSPVKTHYPRKWYLHRESGSWKVSGASFVLGSCTCG
jgi:hypothetical protein